MKPMIRAAPPAFPRSSRRDELGDQPEHGAPPHGDDLVELAEPLLADLFGGKVIHLLQWLLLLSVVWPPRSISRI